MYNAYMIRNDGKEIPVKVHPYGNPENVEETLYASQWLYRNTRYEDVKSSVLYLLVAFAHEQLGASEAIQEELTGWAGSLPYVVLEDDFINSLPDLDNIVFDDSLADLNILICNELNQEFLRARYGGYVNTNSLSKEMTFRISSVGFDWFNIIYMFVANHKNEIEYVTIAKDEEATGYSNYIYKYKGTYFETIPTNEFLELSGNPVVENLTPTSRINRIRMGMSLVDAFKRDTTEVINGAVRSLHQSSLNEDYFVKEK